MPRFDGIGPLGQGAMKGGGRRGYRNCFYATGLPGWMRTRDELSMLKVQAGYLNEELDVIQARIQELENKQNERSL